MKAQTKVDLDSLENMLQNPGTIQYMGRVIRTKCSHFDHRHVIVNMALIGSKMGGSSALYSSCKVFRD